MNWDHLLRLWTLDFSTLDSRLVAARADVLHAMGGHDASGFVTCVYSENPQRGGGGGGQAALHGRHRLRTASAMPRAPSSRLIRPLTVRNAM